ncbi:MAG: hypothetical protein KC729_03705 [Candidatus Eisenbacteria bacterium]|uniref:Uncharacterized protein n=1 Tax=Eiseniibacteriota bacterium TaxID=2212470 RepID=A0A956RN67_UNCEI|nr:hypothetical protein [Candidatus Eisenbacteria bacterium]
MREPDEREYRVEEEAPGKFRVLSSADLTVLVCRDRADAEQHATLLEEAFRRGYKRGYRDGKHAK